MSGPLYGKLECFLNGTGLTTGSAQSMFISIYNFLNNNTGTLGIQRLAYNSGAQGTGMGSTRGMNYYDQANPAGDNAWACFRFSSASHPFDLLIQWTGGGGVGAAPGSPGLLANAATTNAIAFAMAQRTDGSSSWGGSTNNNGSDTKSTPVWISSSIATYYPRSNDHRRSGAHAAQKQNMFGRSGFSSLSWRAQLLADYDNFIFMLDVGAVNAYNIISFGSYTPVSGLIPDLPYCAWADTTSGPAAAGVLFGTVAGTTTIGNGDGGGVSYPNVSLSGTCTFTFDRMANANGFMTNAEAQPNRMFATQRFDEFPILIGARESPNQVGLLGYKDLITEAYNIATHDTNAAGTRAVFGTTTLAAIKWVIPFHSGTTPGTGTTREGVDVGPF